MSSSNRQAPQPVIRLNNSMRDGIIKRAVKARFDKEIEAQTKAEDRLARKLFANVYPESERRAAAKLPTRWVKTTNRLSFNVGGWNAQLSLCGEAVRVPADYHYHTQDVVKDTALIKEAQAFLQSVEADKLARKEAEAVLRGLVYSVSSVGGLRSIWPDGEPFYRDIQAPPATQIAPVVADVNRMFRLPMKKEAA